MKMIACLIGGARCPHRAAFSGERPSRAQQRQTAKILNHSNFKSQPRPSEEARRSRRFNANPTANKNHFDKSISMKIFILLLLTLALPLSSFSKAAYYGKREMIKQAEIIAIVNVSKIESAAAKGKGWTYGEVATARVEKVLKGKLPETALLYGKENFICAQVHYQPGRQIVFLRHDKDLLTGVNWHLGVRPIKNEQVDWFIDDKQLNLNSAPASEVLQEIETIIQEK
jgi:hypothetical protein